MLWLKQPAINKYVCKSNVLACIWFYLIERNFKSQTLRLFSRIWISFVCTRERCFRSFIRSLSSTKLKITVHQFSILFWKWERAIEYDILVVAHSLYEFQLDFLKLLCNQYRFEYLRVQSSETTQNTFCVVNSTFSYWASKCSRSSHKVINFDFILKKICRRSMKSLWF